MAMRFYLLPVSDSHVADKWTSRGVGTVGRIAEFHACTLRASTTAEVADAQRRPDERQTGTQRRPRSLPLPAPLLLHQSDVTTLRHYPHEIAFHNFIIINSFIHRTFPLAASASATDTPTRVPTTPNSK